MDALGQLAVLGTLMRQLCEVIARENGCIRSLQLDLLHRLAAEKLALAANFESELDRLRRAPLTLAELPDQTRRGFEDELRMFRAAAAENARVLVAARDVLEGLLRRLSSGDHAPSLPTAGGPGSSRSAQVVPMSVRRQL